VNTRSARFALGGSAFQYPDNSPTLGLRCQGYRPIEFGPMKEPLDEDQVYKVLAEMGRKGGRARAKKLSPERRKEIATTASKAAAKKRSADAKKRRKQ
jgi:hypothetical protein